MHCSVTLGVDYLPLLCWLIIWLGLSVKRWGVWLLRGGVTAQLAVLFGLHFHLSVFMLLGRLPLSSKLESYPTHIVSSTCSHA